MSNSSGKKTRLKVAACGTISGRHAHFRKKEKPCDDCRKALNDYQKSRIRKTSEYIENYKLKAGCADCGYNEYSYVLDFDHIGEKKFNIGTSRTKPLDEIIKEISMCEVVCSNCHRIRTATRRQNNK